MQLVSLETRRDERSEIDNKSKAKRVGTSLWFPTEEGKEGQQTQARDLPLVLECTLSCAERTV